MNKLLAICIASPVVGAAATAFGQRSGNDGVRDRFVGGWRLVSIEQQGAAANAGKGVLVVSTCLRMVRSINRQMRSAKSNMRPKASMRAGFFRKRLFIMTGSLRKP